MMVRVEKAACVREPAELASDTREPRDEREPVSVVVDDREVGIPTRNHVVNRAGRFVS
jgi:hypothetical protein